MLNTLFLINNFRSFNDEIPVLTRPITLNIGPNNSGKSSFSKFIQLLQHSVQENSSKYEEDANPFQEIHTFGLGNLGNIEEILHSNSKDRLFGFTTLIPIEYLPEELIKYSIKLNFQFRFRQDFNDNNGVKIKIEKETKKTSRFLPGTAILWSITLTANDELLFSIKDTDEIWVEHGPIIETYKLLEINFGLVNSILKNEKRNLEDESSIVSTKYGIEETSFNQENFIFNLFDKFNQEEDVDFPFFILLAKIAQHVVTYYKKFSISLQKTSFIDLYRANQGRHINNQSNKLLNQSFLNYVTPYGEREFKMAMKEILPLFDLSDDIEMEFNPNYGFTVYIKDEHNNLRNLADYGSGVNQLLPLFILATLNTKQHLKRLMYIPHENIETIFVEEPEINLHPNYQSKLADLFNILRKKSNLNFVIETHSEYLVRKFQYLVGNKEVNHDEIVINYFWKENGTTKCKQIYFNENGGLSDTFEKGFYDESLMLQMELLKINTLN